MVVLALLRQILAAPPRESDEYQVQLVQVLFRHGARTPLTPSDPDAFYRMWGDCRNPQNLAEMRKCRHGDLTPLGEGQLLKLGTLFRERFVETGFLNPALDPRQILATSTPSPRTIMSCKLVLKGLFPQLDLLTMETKDDMAPFASGTTPYACPTGKIKIYTQPWEETFINGNYLTNPRLRTLYHSGRAALHSEEMETKRKAHADALGLPKHPVPSWIFLADEIHCRHGHQKPQNEQLSNEMQLEALENARKELNHIQHGFSAETLQIGVRPFINQLMMRITSVVRNECPELRCVLYSGHDTSLTPLRPAFGFHSETWPPFASYMMWELLKKKSASKPTITSVLASPSSTSSSSSPSTSFSMDKYISADTKEEWAVRVTWNGQDSITVPLSTLQQRLLDHGFLGPVEIEAMHPEPPTFEWGWAPHQLGTVPVVPK
jgi:hypothetical protein